ncbi:integrase, catalytic region, zinc finger, CCHC-type containing protein [Tanacetum coccineum]
MFDGVHDICLLDFVENVNSRAKSAKKHKKQNIWKPKGHVFTEVGLKWKPTCRTFTIVGNSCPLTRITSANVVPPKKTTSHSIETQKLKLKVYSRKPKNVKNVGSSKKVKIVESKNANHSEPNHTWGSNATDIPSSSSLVLTVAFRKNTCFIRNLEGVDLLFGSRDTNLYTISLDDMLKTSPICLLSKASKTKSWLWHDRLSHLNFGTLNKLAKDGLARGIPRLKFQKDHLCSACALGKSKKSSHQPKAEDTNQEKLYLLHMDLCGPMRVASINGKSLLHPKPFINPPSLEQNSYELMQEKKPDLSFFHVFCALCYPTNDNDDLGKLDAKADIGIVVGYAPAKKAFRIYNKRTRKIIETIHVTFDELITMSSEQFSSRPGLHSMTPATSSSGLTPNPIPQQPFQEVAAPRDVVLADSLVSTSIDQDAPSSSTPSTQEQEQSLNISQVFKESPKTLIFRDDPLNESPHEESTSQGSSSNVRQTHTPFEYLGKWTKNHLIANVIDDPSCSVFMRKQLQTDAMWCYFDAFLTSIEPKNFKQAMTEPSWIDAI